MKAFRAAPPILACAVAGLLLGCRADPVAAPDVIAVSVRAGPSIRRMIAHVEPGGVAEELRRARPDLEFRGSLGVTPGLHTLRVDAYDARRQRVTESTASITVTRGDPALVLLAIPGAHPSAAGRGAPVVEVLTSPRTSVVAGAKFVLEARVAGGEEISHSWTATPPGCGIFGSPAATSTSFTGTVAGPCTATLAAASDGGADRRSVEIIVRSRARSYLYPLRLSGDRRYLVDQRGTPFLLKGETAWLALVNLTEEEQDAYLQDRDDKGFNTVEVMLLNANYTKTPNPVPPANRYGELPFRVPGAFATADDAYFDRAAAFVDRAARHGVLVLVAPMYLGYDGGREGWFASLDAPGNTRDVCRRYGRFVGSKFKERNNVVWVAGGDHAPPPGSEAEARHWEMLQGIQEAGAHQLWTGHWNFGHKGGISTDEPLFAPAMDLNGVYQYVDTYRYTARAFGVRPPRPVFLLESAYEREHARTEMQPFRKAWWWSMLSGAAGVLWSNNFLWMCESARGTYAAEYGSADRTVSSWAAELDSAGTYEAMHLHALFEALPWHRLVPMHVMDGALVVSGEGHRRDRIVAAATPERDVIVVYVPLTGRRTRSFTVDLSGVRAPVRARWFDPSTGEYVPIAMPPALRNAVEFTTPGANRSGTNDWVLVVQADIPAGRPGGPAP